MEALPLAVGSLVLQRDWKFKTQVGLGSLSEGGLTKESSQVKRQDG